MAVLGWIIISLFALGYIFGPPFLFDPYDLGDYLRLLGSWLGTMLCMALVLALLLFALHAVMVG